MPIINQAVKGGGSTPVIDALNVTPSTSAQTITAPSGVDGYSPVNVSAVTSAIDANIVAGNIKKDVEILGVTGSYEGQTPTGTMYIISNGTYNVVDKAIANVNVPTTAPAHYVEKAVDANGKLINSTNIINLNGVTDIGQEILRGAYTGVSFPANTSVDFSSLTTVSGQRGCYSTFQGCSGLTSVDLSGLTTVSGSEACYSMFQTCRGLTSLDFSSLTTISGSSSCAYMFYGCTALTSLDFRSLTTVNNNMGCRQMFYGCTGLTSINLSSLTTVSGSSACVEMFRGCTGLTSINLSSLTTVSNDSACDSMFNGCSSLTNVNIPSLSVLTGNSALRYMFSNCAGLTRLSFYALDTNSFGTRTNLFNNMLSGVTGCTVHFPMRIQATIGSWSDVTNGFGGTNTTVLFDIVCTLTGADTNTYTRSQKNSTSTATAWDNGGTLYYTSGTTEPTVGATIYSDSACTTAVTTIDSIA